MKKLLMNILLGVGLGSAIFLIVGIVIDMQNGGNFASTDFLFTKMAIGSMIVGIGFAVPSVVYYVDRLPLGTQIVIHMGIGCAIMLVVAFAVGWIPTSAGWLASLLTVLGEVAIAFAIWLVFSVYHRNLAKKMTARIQQMQKM